MTPAAGEAEDAEGEDEEDEDMDMAAAAAAVATIISRIFTISSHMGIMHLGGTNRITSEG